MLGLKGIDADDLERSPDLKAFIRRFIGDFEVDFSAIGATADIRILSCLLTPRHDVNIMFGIDKPLLCLAFFDSFAALPIGEEISRCIAKLEASKLQYDARYVVLCSTGDNSRNAADVMSLLSDQVSVFITIPLDQPKEELSGVKTELFRQIGIKNYFDNADPIRSDSMFFGRQRILTGVLGSIRDGQNVGLFGLRRVGKTSILYAIDRIISQKGMGNNLLISLDEPSVVQLRWYQLLEHIAQRLSNNTLVPAYSEQEGSRFFKKAISDWLSARPGKQLIISFDEIEHIVPGTCKRLHWDADYFYLWDTLRSVTREITAFSVIICGINSRALESGYLADLPNPIFNGMRIVYVPMFNLDETLQMVSKLGLYMGASFAIDAVSHIHKEYGGHPLLIRQACSHIFQQLERDGSPWPFSVTDTVARIIVKQQRPFLFYWCSYVLQTLKEFYPDEFEMLRVLAGGDVEFYLSMEASYPEHARHLRGYGLVIGGAELGMPFLQGFMQSKERDGIDNVISVKQALSANETASVARREFDIALFAALDDEVDAFLKLLKSPKSVTDLHAEIPYEMYEAEVQSKTGGRKLRVLVCSTGQIGPSHAQNLVLHIALRFNISTFILFGICAGVKNETKIGDIVIADQIIDYSQAKRTTGGDEERPRVFPVGARLYNCARKYRRFSWPDVPQDITAISDRRIVYGNMASGPTVFADKQSMRRMIKRWPKMVGAEMEAAGALHALHSIGKGDSFLVIKCVSDLGDERKSDKHKSLCCATAAAFALDLIRSRAWESHSND